jgi:hypothetical protein
MPIFVRISDKDCHLNEGVVKAHHINLLIIQTIILFVFAGIKIVASIRQASTTVSYSFYKTTLFEPFANGITSC